MPSSTKSRSQRPRQEVLDFKPWGGRRTGAGRPPKGARPGVSHLRRVEVTARQPVHVTARVQDIQSLRRGRCYRELRRALTRGADRESFRVVEFCVMSNHVHLICEARDRQALARGLQGLFIRIARALNRQLSRRGSVFADRYHDHVLRTPSEVRNALAYVLNNSRHHAAQQGRRLPAGWLDPCSSAPDFDGWTGRKSRVHRLDDEPPLPRARTWLLRLGWQRAGAIRISEIPGA